MKNNIINNKYGNLFILKIVILPLKCACVVFAALPQYLSDSLERIQKCAFAIIFPGSTYSEALNLAGISTLQGS